MEISLENLHLWLLGCRGLSFGGVGLFLSVHLYTVYVPYLVCQSNVTMHLLLQT